MDLQDLYEFLDECCSAGAGKMFASKLVESAKAKKSLRKVHAKLSAALTELRACKAGGAVAPSSCVLYEAMVYKFGPANRHQKFWRLALQLYRTLKKMNRQSLITPLCNFIEKLEKSDFSYRPTKRAVCFLGALLLRRVVQLDRLRSGCARCADSSMGYIELRHLLTINLMSVAIASDVARQAALHMQHIARVYATLSAWFRKHSENFPSSMDSLELQTMEPGTLLEPKNENKYLTEHDLAILRREIEGIGRTPTDLEDLSSMDISFAMRNPALGRFVSRRRNNTPHQQQLHRSLKNRKRHLRRIKS